MQTIESSTTQSVAPKAYQCRHLFTDGRRCGSRALRGEPFCYHHHATRRPASVKPIAHCGQHSEFDLALPEDRSAIQHNIGEVLRRIAQNQIDSRRAGLLLYGLQIASMNLPRQESRNTRSQDPVDEVITDETLGPIAPRSELASSSSSSSGSVRSSILQLLLEQLALAPEQEQLPIESELAAEPATEPSPSILPTIQAVADRPTDTHDARVPILDSQTCIVLGTHDARVPHPCRSLIAAWVGMNQANPPSPLPLLYSRFTVLTTRSPAA